MFYKKNCFYRSISLLLLFGLTNFNLTFGKVLIMGKALCTQEQMKAFLLKNNPKAQRYLYLVPIYLEEGEKEGVRGDIAWAQSLWETNFFRFGGDVKAEQNNFAGLGAIGHGNPGYYFKTAREGIRAQIQHLKAYASRQSLKQSCVDPRFKKVTKRACAPYVEDLGGKWAYPGYDSKKYKSLVSAQQAQDTYGDKIVKIWRQIQQENLPHQIPHVFYKKRSPSIVNSSLSGPFKISQPKKSVVPFSKKQFHYPLR